MSQLLVIDVQNSYRKYIGKNLYNGIKDISSNFSEIIYLWDSGGGQELYDEIPDEWGAFAEDAPEDNSDYVPFSDSFYFMSKEYGFFRNLMGKGISDEDIINLAKFMIKNKINDLREIKDDTEVFEELRQKISNNVVLVGGGVNECLKEVSLILDILEIKYSINYSLTY